MTGIEAFLEVLAAAKVHHIFGNPGTTELPLNEALSRDGRFRYFFGLHEIPVMAMADGFSIASGNVAVVNLHIGCGLGNAMGMLYNAWVEGTPLLVTAGQQDRRLRFEEPVLDADLVRVARPWTKWAAEVQRVQDIPNAVRRAVQTALAPPRGPVFLALPLDLQMEKADGLDLRPPTLLDPRQRPSREALRRAADVFSQSHSPAILAGSRVLEAGAADEVARLAELLGAPVFSENSTMHGRLPVRPDHPLYQGSLPLWSPQIAETLQAFDALLVVGMSMRLYIYQEPARPISEKTRIVHLDSAPWEIGKNQPVEVGLVADPKAGLLELAELLEASWSSENATRAQERRTRWIVHTLEAREKTIAKLKEHEADRPMTSWTMMGALAKVLPHETAVVEEAITSHHDVFERLGVLRDPAAQIAQRGWALGWGMGATLGVKLAWPDRPVLGLIGDGAALYGIQALWSAAHHRIPVTFVICKNRQYKILKVCGDLLDLPRLQRPDCPGLDLTNPEIDFVGLARAFGVEAERLDDPEALRERVRQSLHTGTAPLLLEVPLAD